MFPLLDHPELRAQNFGAADDSGHHHRSLTAFAKDVASAIGKFVPTTGILHRYKRAHLWDHNFPKIMEEMHTVIRQKVVDEKSDDLYSCALVRFYGSIFATFSPSAASDVKNARHFSVVDLCQILASSIREEIRQRLASAERERTLSFLNESEIPAEKEDTLALVVAPFADVNEAIAARVQKFFLVLKGVVESVCLDDTFESVLEEVERATAGNKDDLRGESDAVANPLSSAHHALNASLLSIPHKSESHMMAECLKNIFHVPRDIHLQQLMDAEELQPVKVICPPRLLQFFTRSTPDDFARL